MEQVKINEIAESHLIILFWLGISILLSYGFSLFFAFLLPGYWAKPHN